MALNWTAPDYKITLKPISIILPPADHYMTKQLVGGAGDQTLSDGLDSTYLRLTWRNYGSSPGTWFEPIITFEANESVPSDIIFFRAQMHARTRRIAARDHTLGFDLGREMYPDELYTDYYHQVSGVCSAPDPYYGEVDGEGWRFNSSDWTNHIAMWWPGSPDIYNDRMPWSSHVREGGIQMFIGPSGVSTSYAGDIMDISDIHLVLEGTADCTDNPSCTYTYRGPL